MANNKRGREDKVKTQRLFKILELIRIYI
jgi:hypothetical protein